MNQTKEGPLCQRQRTQDRTGNHPIIKLKPNPHRFRQKKKDQNLQLSPKQVRDHLPGGDPRRVPQSWQVQGAREAIGVAEEQHRRDPSPGVLEREARRLHLVLLDLAARQVVHAALRVHLRLKRSWRIGQLRALQDVEIVISGVAAGVSLGTDGGACI